MAEVFKKGIYTIMKFHQKVKNFKRVEKVSFGKSHYKLFIDKNDSVYDIKECQVLSWKTIEKGRKKINVPDQTVESRDLYLFNKIKGVPSKLAIDKVLSILEYQNI
jgi:hypothetical protein